MELNSIAVEMPEGISVIVGQAHFIKVVEDLHETLAGQGPQLQFGIGFCEASGKCLVRRSGNAGDLVDLATIHAETIGAGHAFIVFMRNAYPISVLNALKQVPEVCTIHCATSNPIEVLVAQTELGRAIIGVVDGMPPAGIEGAQEVSERKRLLRDLGYKL